MGTATVQVHYDTWKPGVMELVEQIVRDVGCTWPPSSQKWVFVLGRGGADELTVINPAVSNAVLIGDILFRLPLRDVTVK